MAETICLAYEVGPGARFILGGVAYEVTSSMPGLANDRWDMLASRIDGLGSLYLSIRDDAPFALIHDVAAVA